MYVARHHRHSTPPMIEDTLTSAIKKVRSDDCDNDWVLAGFEGRDTIQLISTGTGGIEALKANLVEWDVCYGLVRASHTLERAGCVQTDFIKFAWVYWRPQNIPVVRKMKIGVHEGQMKQLFSPYHAELHVESVSEIGEGPLAELLDCVTMRADKTATKPLLASPARRSTARMHWARARSLLPSVQLAIANEHKKVGTTDVSFEDPTAFASAIKAVRSDITFADWCLVGYKSKKTLGVVGGGRGGLDALLDATEPTGVNYGLLRVSEKFDMVFHEAFCFITWMPEEVPAVVKARTSTHQAAVATAFRSHVHCQFQFRAAERGDITLESIRDRIRQVIGSQGNVSRKVPKPRYTVPKKIKAPSTVATIPTALPTAIPTAAATAAAAATARDPHVTTTTTTTTSTTTKKSVTVRSPVSMAVSRPPTVVDTPPIYSAMDMSSDAEEEPEKAPAKSKPINVARPTVVTAAAEPKKNKVVFSTTSPVPAQAKYKTKNPPKLFQSGAGARGEKHETKSEMKMAGEETQDGGPSMMLLQEAVEKVKKGGDKTDFVVVGWRHGAVEGGEKRGQLELKETGTGGVQALAECLQAHSVMYGLVRVTETVGTSEREKFCCVRWAPEAVPAATRSEVGGLQGEISRLFHPYHGDLTASNPSEVTPEAVAARISKIRLKQ